MRPLAALALFLLLAGCASPVAAPHLPDGIAVLGDSISRATNVKGEEFTEYPVHSWATGNDPTDGIESHFERLRALDPTLDIVAFNDARSGARMDALARQAEEATRQRAQYVVVLMGANDACARTPPAAFRAELDDAAEALATLEAEIFLTSVPNVTQLAALFSNNATALAVWDAFDVCPAALGPDADIAGVDADLRAYNEALREVADARGWRWDGGAVFATVFTAEDVSTVDYFHPSLAGQARLAAATWETGPYAHWTT